MTQDQLPDPLPPPLWCDFNSGDEEGRYWALGPEELMSLPAEVGQQVLLWDWEEEPSQVLAQVAVLEVENGRWCARPSGDSFYIGPVPW